MRAVVALLCAACLLAAAAFAGAALAATQLRPHHRTHPATEKKRCHVRRHHKRRCFHKGHKKRHLRHSPAGGGSPATTPVTDPAEGSSGNGTSPPPPTPLGHLQVIEREFSVVPSRTTLAGGTVAVELDNRGQDPHNLRIERSDATGIPFEFGLARPGSVSSHKLELGPGTWKLYCTLPGHEEAGMHALITVTG